MYKDRAKTKTQKKEFLRRMEKLWDENPNLRFSQLLENVFHHTSNDHCFYFVEDFSLLEELEQFYGKVKESNIN